MHANKSPELVKEVLKSIRLNSDWGHTRLRIVTFAISLTENTLRLVGNKMECIKKDLVSAA